MLEIGMIVSLAAMGVYFFKSTELPKELLERSAQAKREQVEVRATSVKKSFPKIEINSIASNNAEQTEKLAAMKLQKKTREIQILNLEIDRITIEITTLEQEINANNTRNAEILAIIDGHLAKLSELNEKISLLS